MSKPPGDVATHTALNSNPTGTKIVRIEIPKKNLVLDMAIQQEICKGCGLCVEFCPTRVLDLGAHFNSKGYEYPEVIKPEACSGCRMCSMICPDFAIFFIKAKE